MDNWATYFPLALVGYFLRCKSILVLLAMLCPYLGLGSSVDSLRSAFQASSGLEKASFAFDLGKSFRGKDVDSLIHYHEISVDILENMPDTFAPVEYRIRYIGALMDKGLLEDALTESKVALKAGKARNDTFFIGRLYPQQVNLLRYKGDLKGALEAGQEGLGILEKSQDNLFLAQAYINLGVVCNDLYDSEQALEYYNRGLNSAELASDSTSLYVATGNIAAIYYDLGKLDTAFALLDRSFEIAKETQDSIHWFAPLLNLGEMSLKNREYAKSKEYFDLAEVVVEAHKNPVYTLLVYLGKTGYFTEVKMETEALDYLARASKIHQSLGNAEMTENIYERRIEVYEKFGNLEEALKWQKELQSLQDSLQGAENMAEINEMKERFASERKEKENELLRLKNERSEARSRTFLIIGILVVAFLAGLLFFLTVVIRRKSRFNQELEMKQTQLHAQNQSLEVLNQEKDALMAIVAHDLKAPLIKAEGLGHLVETEQGISNQGQQALKMMQSTFQGALVLVDEIVLISQLESKTSQVELNPVDLTGLLDQAVKTFQPLAVKKGIALQMELAPLLPQIHSYAPYVKRIMDNLLSNAMKFSHAGTNVWLNATREGDKVVVEIRDQGPGIPEKELPKIFQKFNRLTNRPTGGESSTGLGLSIVAQLAEALTIEIGVESTLGIGTSFFLKIPLAQSNVRF